jgi:hypothetical protein
MIERIKLADGRIFRRIPDRADGERLDRGSRENYVRTEVRELAAEGEVSIEEWDQPLNGYEREVLAPALTNAALLEFLPHVLRNCSRGHSPPVSYDDAVMHTWAPMLAARLAAAETEIARLRTEVGAVVAVHAEIADVAPDFGDEVVIADLAADVGAVLGGG